jgi:hypothetical protein
MRDLLAGRPFSLPGIIASSEIAPTPFSIADFNTGLILIDSKFVLQCCLGGEIALDRNAGSAYSEGWRHGFTPKHMG